MRWWPASVAALLLAGLAAQAWAPGAFGTVFGTYPETLAVLALDHLLLTLVSAGLAAALAVAMAAAVTRGPGRAFRPAAETLVSVGQTVPPVAVLALAVPALGFGFAPALIALTLYALLPVLQGALAGFDAVPDAARDAADGIGFGPWRRLLGVDLPLAWPLILAGLRVAVAIGTGTATIASTAGVRTLGTPIIVGLDAGETGYVAQGAVAVALLAVALDGALALLGPGTPSAARLHRAASG